MFTFLSNLKVLAKDERGVTALEYGLIAGLVAVVIVVSVTALGPRWRPLSQGQLRHNPALIDRRRRWADTA